MYAGDPQWVLRVDTPRAVGASAAGCGARTKLRAFHAASGQVYGRPRLWKDLKEDGEAVSEKRVKRLMWEEQIQGKVPKRFKQTTNSHHEDPIAANVLDRDFTAAAPNQRWVGDTTEFVIGENAKLYLAAILDLYSRFVVGWAISAVNDRRLTLKALEMAVQRRCPEPGLLHHSDRGCTYTCEDYQRYLATHGITCSMSRRADCYDCEHDLVAVRPGLTPAMNDFVSWR